MALIIWAVGKKFQNFVLTKKILVVSVYKEFIFSLGNEDSDMINCIECELKATTWPCKV